MLIKTVLAAGIVLLGSPFAGAAEPEMSSFKEPVLGFTVAVPKACRLTTRPGTIEAICSPDLDVRKAARLAAAGAWLFEVDFEVAPVDAPVYSIEAFRSELADTVCGESDAGKVAVSNVHENTGPEAVTFSATVACPALGFLGLPERRAEARVIIAGAKRIRMMARTPANEAGQAAPLAKAFLASFKLSPP